MINLKYLTYCPSVISHTGLDISKSLSFYTDTRKYRSPGAFVAIPGAKINPLDILTEILENGCPLVVYQWNEVNQDKVKTLSEKYSKTYFLPVKDSVSFLQELTHHHIKDWKNKSSKNIVFAISGSNGKTTHKEMLSFILAKTFPGKIVATEKNNNNHLGVPLTLLDVTDQTEMVVLELGSNHPGEIKILCDIAQPNAGITTNIGATHLEFFGSEEKVFEEEGYLFQAVKSVTAGKGFFLINVDDAFLQKLVPSSGSITYGTGSASEAKVTFLEDGAAIQYQGKELVAHNPHITGRHNKFNLITCLFIANHFYPDYKEELHSAASAFRPTKNRSEWIEFEQRPVFLDAYNANPSSMKAALLGFKESLLEQGFKINQACVVLGDMNELGDSTPQYHEEVAHYVKELGFTHVYFVGRFAAHYQKGYAEGQSRVSSSQFKNEYRNECLKKFAIHFIKGSRSLQLESLFDIT